MVQLKSFRYVEPEALIGQATVVTTTTRTNEDETHPGNNDESTTNSATSSSRSISSLTGGALTSESSNSEHATMMPVTVIGASTKTKNTEERLPPAVESINKSSDEEGTTLSSNEEYQLAKHDIADEDEDDDGGENDVVDEMRAISANSGLSSPTEAGIGVVTDTSSTTPTPGVTIPPGTRGIFAKSPLVSHRGASERGSRTPLTPRQQYHIARQQAGSPILAPISRQSPKLRAGSPNDNGYNGVHRLNLATNHFEIRWRNINLVARKSTTIRFIEDNPIYKFFKGKRDQGEKKEEIYYSPPIRHKTLSTTILPATISEHLELSTKSEMQNQQTNFDSQTNVGSEYRPILSNVSGSVFSGQLTAVLGPSGVGKTTLLNSLTGRNTLDGTGRVSLLGGASKRMSVVTVPQADVLPSKLTALEDLQFTSRIKNPQKGFNHARNIERVVRHLHMEKFLNTRIEKLSGGEARRLSIGRELLNQPDIMILDEPTSGLDANTCKKIITALRDIVEHSDNILDRPMAIIITIHQPQQEVLNLFHRVYVMALGGRAIYEGPPSSLLPSLLEHSSLSRVCPVDQLNENPAIVALEVASGEYGPNVLGELALHHECQAYEESLYVSDEGGAFHTNSPFSTPRGLRSPRKSPLSVSPRLESPLQWRLQSTSPNATLDNADGSLGRPTPMTTRRLARPIQFDRMSSITSLSYASTYDADLPEPVSKLKVDKRLRRSVVMKSDFLSHTLTLMSRCWLLTTRDTFLMGIRVIGYLLVAGGIVQIFSHALDPNEHQCPTFESEVDDMVGYMETTKERLVGLQSTLRQASSTHLFFFHLVLCLTMVTSALAGLVFPLQMRMFIREYKNGWYTPASFITSQTLAELPVDMIGPAISLLITYPLCHQPTSEYYWREIGYIVVLTISSIICKSQAQIVGAFLMDSVENSVFASCVMVTPPALLSGIAVRVSSMSWPLQLISWGSFLRYTFESLFVIRYGYGICPCDPEIINGYPLRTSANAIPPHLENLAQGFLELGLPTSTASPSRIANSTEAIGTGVASGTVAELVVANADNSNLFVRFLQLVTEAANQFVPNPSQLGDCAKYRSIYLMDMDIEDRILFKWVAIMLMIFIISRFLTYFVIKAVIKMRRQ